MSDNRKNIKIVNETSQKIVEWAEKQKYETIFDRAQKMKPCPIGESGACCRMCHIGPCRLTGKNAGEDAMGVCGANMDVVVARNYLRMVAGGAAAHSDHARELVKTLLAVARGETDIFQIKDKGKLLSVAMAMDIDHPVVKELRGEKRVTEGDFDLMPWEIDSVSGEHIKEIAEKVALTHLAQFGQQEGELVYLKRAPKGTYDRWAKHNLRPRGVDREITEAMHRTTMGVDQDAESIMDHALRVALVDGWGGCLVASDIADILFGTPTPKQVEAGLAVLKKDEVNLIVHGHEPLLAGALVDTYDDPEIAAYAKSKGAKGVNLAGMCCTANEILTRNGIPAAGSFLEQELAIMTGIVDAMTVDVQCIQPVVAELSKKFHTKVITTSPKGHMTGAVHIEFDEHHAKDTAKRILKMAIDNFANRTGRGAPIDELEAKSAVVGFSREYFSYMQGGSYRKAFRVLNDAIMAGRIRGTAGIAACHHPRTVGAAIQKYLIEELVRNDFFVVVAGCGGHCGMQMGYATPETAFRYSGPGMREVCEAAGMPPVMHIGACVDTARVLMIRTLMATTGGLSPEMAGMPSIAFAPEWWSEKALAIGTYFVASGSTVIFGGESPVGASRKVVEIMEKKWLDKVGAAFFFESDPEKMLQKGIEWVDTRREQLKLAKYQPGRFQKERVLMDMAARRELDKAAKAHAEI